MGRAARGVRGIRLEGDDYVVGVAVVDEEKKLLTITERGMGKRSEFEDFRLMKNRGGRGVLAHKISEKSGKLAAIITVSDDDDIMIITNEGTIIRTPVSNISVYSRTAGGVIVMRLSEGSYINNITRIEKESEIEKKRAIEDEEIKNSEPAPVSAPVTDEEEDIENENEAE